MTQQQEQQQQKQLQKPSAVQTDEHKRRSLGFLEMMFLVQTVQVGIGLFNLPRVVVEEAGHPGWIAVLIAGVAAHIAIWICILLTRRFPDLDLYGMLTRVYGKWIGWFFGAVFMLYCVAMSALVGRTYVEVVQLWMFPTTSTNMFYLLLLLPCFYAATAGPRVLARLATLVFFATSWMLLLLIAPARQITWDYYFPIFFNTTLWDLTRAAWKVGASMVGFELLLIFHTFAKDKKKTLKAASFGNGITVFIYLLVTLVSIGFYSAGQIIKVLSPTLHMFQIVELPLIERIEHIGISTWSFLIVNTVCTYLWAGGRFLYTFGKWSEPVCVLMLFPPVFLIGIMGRDVFFLTKFELYLGTIGGLMSTVMPLFLLLSAMILRKRGGTSAPPAPPEDSQEVSVS
ncbi:GerAB/ArcD/ProY family transporter [Tumebacillus flagellatus]|uniref:Uncharacterized protein n=1 Tax=Tumebacillus flagellatus TaxID=1157490 RepID=A0A074LU15_9BACL|nr:GerAB/ArcD/ProY family transporter [Tumebacillus flagellatus]KEO83368.1 hypothetical protein EL26_10345 [Tumebacillus flagellatus]